MYVIMAYDVGVERVVKVLKVGRKYLTHIQNSLLEGELSQAKFKQLQGEVDKVIDPSHDTVLFYTLRSQKDVRKSRLGIALSDPDDIL